ncbi:membrane protein [Gordonia phage Baddon]|nr:membrane protein [Gordonia phage Baddon]
MSGYRPRPAGRWRGSVPPPGGAGVARPGSARDLRDVPRIAAVVRVGSEVARFDDRGHLIAASSRFWEALRNGEGIDARYTPGEVVTDAIRERVNGLIQQAEVNERRRLAGEWAAQREARAAVMSAQHEAQSAAHLAGGGVLFDPNLGRKDTVARWPITDLVEFIDRSGTQMPDLPPNVELQQFVAKIVEHAKAEGREVCALVRDHGGRLTKVLGYPNGNHRVDVQDAPAVHVDLTPPRRPDPFLRVFRALVAVFETFANTMRNHPRRYFGIGVPLILIATGQVGAWLAAIDWAVVVVSTLIVLAGVFVVALSVSRRNYRREIADQQAALAERAQQQHEEWLKE